MEVNYVLMYGTPYLKYREFETFEDVSKFLVNKGIVNYSIFKKLEDDKEVEMIYRDNDIAYLKNIRKEALEYINSDEMLKLREEFEYCNDKDLFDNFVGHLDKILRGSDK
jgi:L-rhamnose mutarotase